jgi:hypothetical protein
MRMSVRRSRSTASRLERLRRFAVAQQRAAAHLQTQCPVSAGGLRTLRELLERRCGALALAAAHSRLDELRQDERREPELVRMLAGPLSRVQRVPVTAEAVAEHGRGIVDERPAHAFAARGGLLQAGADERSDFCFSPAPCGQR